METKPRSVLFVDDEESNLVVWDAAYSDQFHVLVANGAERALALMQEHEVAVVLADQRMPGVSGVELLEKIRSEFPNTVRMLITAYSDLGAAVDAINRGHVRRYLRKPCTLPELRAAIMEALELYDLRSRVRAAERRLLLTERVYALGVVAATLGKEIARPAAWIRESVSGAQSELFDLSRRLSAQGIEPSVIRARLHELEGTLDRALQGAEQVLAIARSVELAPPEPGVEAVELTEVIRVTLKLVRGEIRRGTDVQLDLAQVSPVRGTPAKLGQVVLNLLVNAITALDELPPAERSLVVRCQERDGAVRLEVMDNGPCIAEGDMKGLFDPFHVSSSARGSGLGLAISKAIVDELGGTLDAANRSGEGVLFRVVLPVAAPPRS